jgi:glycosyltransferase involved in cell wall biosynthesis
MEAMAKAATLKAGFVIEQTLGHVTHGKNLRESLSEEPDLETEWLDVPFRPSQRLYRTPPVSANWSLRGGLYARNQLMANGWQSLDALFVHTMTVSLFSTPVYEKVPTIISTDATPINTDSLALGYGHRKQPGPVEAVKAALARNALRKAAGYVSWSEWAKQSLVDDYGVAPEKVLVAAPGTEICTFTRSQPRRPGPPRILFVGGDFVRKGGDVLLEAYRRRLRGKAELHIVSGYAVPEQEGVFRYEGLTANSRDLVDLYTQADVFALPTRADCLAVVLGEAMAASLPIITTNVGAHAEAVQDGVNGLIVPPGDHEALGDALERLIDDRVLREEMGQRGRCIAEQRFDAHKNARAIIEHMRAAAEGAL